MCFAKQGGVVRPRPVARGQMQVPEVIGCLKMRALQEKLAEESQARLFG